MADACGCPPTADGDAKGVHHVIVNVNDLARSREFYGWLLPRLGYPGCTDDGAVVGWYGTAGRFLVKQGGGRIAAPGVLKGRGGGCGIALCAPRRRPGGMLPRGVAAPGRPMS